MIYRYIFGCIIKIHQSEQTVLHFFHPCSYLLLSDNIYTRSGRYRNYGKSIISIQLIEFWRHYLVMLFNKYMWQINSSGNLLWKKYPRNNKGSNRLQTPLQADETEPVCCLISIHINICGQCTNDCAFPGAQSCLSTPR